MRLARLQTPFGSTYALEQGDHWSLLDGGLPPIGDEPLQLTGDTIAGSDAVFLAPVEPRVVVGMAYNGSPERRSEAPRAFLKSSRTVTDPGAVVTIDTSLGETVLEGELAVVIGAPARQLTAENALSVVLGYTIVNDVTALAQVAEDPMMTQAKNGDGFTPLGPWIETDFDPFDARISVSKNGGPAIEASTSQLARDVVELLVYVTRYLSLDAGDILLTGCPGTAIPIVPGDTFSVSIAGLGTLTNPAR